MYRLRRATRADLPLIHRMQDIPEREAILTSPLLPLAEFLEHSGDAMESGDEIYCILEEGDAARGFLWICVPDETCEIWGRHLRTLFHACAWCAFEQLGMPRLTWCVRQNNRRFLSVCELFQIRKTGEGFLCHIEEKFEYIAVGAVNYYEFLADEYRDRIPLLEAHSMGTRIFSPGESDQLYTGPREGPSTGGAHGQNRSRDQSCRS